MIRSRRGERRICAGIIRAGFMVGSRGCSVISSARQRSWWFVTGKGKEEGRETQRHRKKDVSRM